MKRLPTPFGTVCSKFQEKKCKKGKGVVLIYNEQKEIKIRNFGGREIHLIFLEFRIYDQFSTFRAHCELSDLSIYLLYQ